MSVNLLAHCGVELLLLLLHALDVPRLHALLLQNLNLFGLPEGLEVGQVFLVR